MSTDQICLQLNGMGPELEAIEGFIHDLVEAQAASSSPNHVAVSSWDGELTYAQLENYAWKLAWHLKSCCDVGPDVLVPICIEKPMWTIV